MAQLERESRLVYYSACRTLTSFRPAPRRLRCTNQRSGRTTQVASRSRHQRQTTCARLLRRGCEWLPLALRCSKVDASQDKHPPRQLSHGLFIWGCLRCCKRRRARRCKARARPWGFLLEHLDRSHQLRRLIECLLIEVQISPPPLRVS